MSAPPLSRHQEQQSQISCSGTDTAEPLLTFQSPTKCWHVILSDLSHHLCLFLSPEKADFLLCCFSVVNKEPEGHDSACFITSGVQWSYAPVLSQIRSRVVEAYKTLSALGACNCKKVASNRIAVFKSCSTWWEPLTVSVSSCCFSAVCRSWHQNLCQSDISIAAPIDWNKNNNLKLTAVMEWNVSTEGTAQLFIANAKIVGSTLLWKIFHPICIVTDMIIMLTKPRHHDV